PLRQLLEHAERGIEPAAHWWCGLRREPNEVIAQSALPQGEQISWRGERLLERALHGLEKSTRGGAQEHLRIAGDELVEDGHTGNGKRRGGGRMVGSWPRH